MKINFGQHIINVLKNHECVVLPELGAFILKDKPAHIADNQIFVSSKSIHFNKNITSNDNLLQSELMTQKGCSFLEAKLEIVEFVRDINFYVQQKGFYDIQDLGRFSFQNEVLTFVAKPQIYTLSKSHFGLENLSLQAISREVIREEKIVREIPVQKERTILLDQEPKVIPIKQELLEPKKKTKLVPLVGLAASLVLIFALSTLMATQTNFSGLQIQNANVLNFLVPSKSEVKSTDKVLNRIEEEEAVSENLASNIRLSAQEKPRKKKKREKPESLNALADDLKTPEEKVSPVEVKETEIKKFDPVYEDVLQVESDNPAGFYVVTGAYSTLANANKAKYDCSIENTCKVFKTESGMYRVGIYTTTDKEIAVDIVKEYKKTNSSYWLMESL